jgi:hypothetical protein
MSTVVSLRDRLLAVDWNFGVDETRAQTKARIALFREFLRRAAPYAGGADEADGAAQSAQPAPWPFFDVAARIDATVRAPEGVLTEVAGKVPQYPATAVRNSCLFALQFAALYDAGIAPDRGQDPFAPLVYMFELGGAFGLDRSGLIQIGIATVGFDTPAHWLDQPVSDSLPAFPDLAGTWSD